MSEEQKKEMEPAGVEDIEIECADIREIKAARLDDEQDVDKGMGIIPWHYRRRAKQVQVKARIVGTGRVLVTCNQCGQQWSLDRLRRGKLPRDWWKCPKGCNHGEGGEPDGTGA